MVSQTYAAEAAHPNTQSNGVIFVVLFSLTLLLAYACFHGYIVEGFIYSLSYFFDNFQVKIHNNNVIADIALLVVILLALFGLYCVFKFFFAIAVTALIIAVLVAFFLAPYDTKQHTVKIKPSDKFETVWGG